MRKILIFCAFIALSGCIGFGKTPNSEFYTLSSQSSDATQAVSTRKLNIGIDEVNVPNYLSRAQIVTLDEDNVSLNISEFNRWSAPLSGLLQRIIADDLALYLPNSMVKPQMYNQQDFNFVVSVEINRMDGTWDKEAVLDVWWVISDNNGKVLSTERSILKRPLGDTYTDYAKAQSALVGELCQAIAQKIAKLKS